MFKITKAPIIVLGYAVFSAVIAWILTESIWEFDFSAFWYRNSWVQLDIFPILSLTTTLGYFYYRYGSNLIAKRIGTSIAIISIALTFITSNAFNMTLYFLFGSIIVCAFDWILDAKNRNS